MTANEMIEKAKAKADNDFERYLVGFNDEMNDTTTDTLKARLEAEKKAYRRQPMYDVRNEPRMTNFINMVIDSGVEVPYQKTNGLPCFGDTVSNTGILTSLLTTQYLHLKGIEHLKTLLAPGHQVPEHTFISHLIMDENKKQPFADELKKAYPEISGASIGYLFAAMTQAEYINLTNKAELHRDMEAFFGWDIGAYSQVTRVFADLKSKKGKIQPYFVKIQNIYKSIE